MIRNCSSCKRRFRAKTRRRLYCSERCKWRGVLSKRSDAKEWEATRKRERGWLKLGWSAEMVAIETQRQAGRCYGCMASGVVLRVDHCHKTGIVRGLLCGHCNLTLGHAKDNPETLRRLMAYLERDRTKTLIYLGGALKNQRIPRVGVQLRKAGFDVMDEWFTPGEHADTNWQAYEKLRGRSYVDALRGRAATNIFLFDKSYIDLCDIFVFVAPAGKSAMAELGYAKGLGKRVYILLDGQDPDRYDIMPGLADGVFKTVPEILEALSV